MKQMLNQWLKNSQLFNNRFSLSEIKHALFKPNCLLCASSQANNHGLCSACLVELPWHPISSCAQCGLSSSGQLCGSCISSPPDFDATQAVFIYQYPIDKMMQRYKYGNMLNISHTFGQLLAEKKPLSYLNSCTFNTSAFNTCAFNTSAVDLIIPMPMHPTRIKQRGFNQALEIAKVLSKNHPDKLDYKSVVRQTLTPPQASLPLKERVKNIKGAFKVKNNLAGKRIAIVDDVMTTGASLNELAKTLKNAGASHIECWVIARTLPHK